MMRQYMNSQSTDSNKLLSATCAFMQVTVNSKPHSLNDNSTVLDLLTELNLVGKRIAVELDGDIVPKSAHASTRLCEGATLEIVVAVGGG